MLQRISVQNLAIVPQAEIEFGPGMNVLTGETGSGKSILIEAIALLAGQKASSTDVRKGEPQAFVEGVVELHKNSKAWSFLDESGISHKDHEIVLKRIIQADGKSKAYINNQAWTVGGLAQFSEFWLDVTSQHAHQKLMDSAAHIEVVDEYGQLDETRENYALSFAKLKKVVTEISELEAKKQKAKEDQDYWTFQFEELSNLNLKAGEIEELQSLYQRSANSHKLSEHIARMKSMLDGEPGITQLLASLEKELASTVRLDAGLEKSLKETESARAQIDEISSFVERYSRSIEHDPQAIEKMNERLSLLQGTVRKYGSIEKAIEKKESIQAMLSLLDDGNEIESQLLEQKKQFEVEVKKKADELTKLRKKSSTDLCKKISIELQELGMKHAKIECIFESTIPEQGYAITIGGKNFTSQGQESVYFNFSPNPGEGFQKLSTIASGGELSRILLAIKSIAIQDNRSNDMTFLFDEVDSGIGGETADRLGIRLSSLSKNGAQVLSVTHLAQIACYAKHHLRVQKVTKQQRTVTEVKQLDQVERKKELARMIGGIEVTDKILAHASELLKKSSTLSPNI